MSHSVPGLRTLSSGQYPRTHALNVTLLLEKSHSASTVPSIVAVSPKRQFGLFYQSHEIVMSRL